MQIRALFLYLPFRDPVPSGYRGDPMRSPTPLRRDLLLSFGIVFAGAILLATVGVFLVLPLLETPAETTMFIGFLILGNLVILFVFGRGLVKRTLLDPIDRLVGDARQMAAGDYQHRIADMDSREFQAVSESVNALADRLIEDRALLAENVESLEETNEELVRVRNQMVQAARLASVGTLAAGIAHEVGNPLGAVLAYVDVALSRARQSGDDTEVLEAVRSEALRIDRIIRGLLDYARPQAGSARSVAPASVLERVREILASQGRLDRVEHHWHVDPAVPDLVIDPARLEQVLVNLILNALDALKDGVRPAIEVVVGVESVEHLQRWERREGDPPGVNYAHRRRVGVGRRSFDPLAGAPEVVVISVSDNGPGLPAGDEERVFDPFFTTKAPGEGTGLGLSICAQLVESMGGRIQAANRPEGGACFTVRLTGAARAERELRIEEARQVER
jgi:C4-dicarboxylate-specific signal transduction histidine kinase